MPEADLRDRPFATAPAPLPAPVPHGPYYVALNAGSGRSETEARQRAIEDVMAAAHAPVHIEVVTSTEALRGVAATLARHAALGHGVLVAAGGDGTINTVASAALVAGCPLGVLPQGTFNYFGRTHGLSEDLAEATRQLLAGRVHPVQVGEVNGRPFLVNASLGLYPLMLEEREALKARLGRRRWVALMAALATLMHEHRPLRLRVDSDGLAGEVRTPTLFVGNNALQLAQLGMDEAGALAQDRLAAIAPLPVGPLKLLGLMLRGAVGRLGNAEAVRSYTFQHMTVRPAKPFDRLPMKLALDGEIIWLRAPLEFRVARRPLLLVKPDADAGPQPGTVVATTQAEATAL